MVEPGDGDDGGRATDHDCRRVPACDGRAVPDDGDDRAVPDGGDGGAPPDAAFALLGDETRMAILEALWEANEPGPREDPVSFSRLREMVDVTPSSRFNYHLGELVGNFVRKTDGGYVLAEAGNRVVRAVMAGAITGETSFEPVELDVACPFCGAPTEAHHRTELLDVSCTECEGMLGGEAVPEGSLLLQVVPPAGVTGRTPEAAARAALQYVYLRVQATVEGVCPECAGTVSGSLTVCEDHDASDGLCPACDSRYAAWPRRTCDNCKFSTIYPVWFRALSHPEVAALCRRHEVDPGPALSWETWAALTPVGTRVAATDPLAVEVTLSLGDESVTATLDRSMDVVDVSG